MNPRRSWRRRPSFINTPQQEDRSRVPSPGGWTVPEGARPGWNWIPAGGATPRLDRMPGWVRAWYRTPFLDRSAHVWMWRHGGWDVDPVDA